MGSRQKNTVRVYSYGYQRWTRWAKQFAEIDVLPAQPKHIVLYLISLSETASSASPIITAVQSLAWAHKLSGLPDPTIDTLVTTIKDSLCRSLGKSGHNTKQPLQVEALSRLVKKYGKYGSLLCDLRLISLCLLAFSAFLRYDEVSRVCRSDLHFHDEYLALFVQKSKTDKYKVGSWIVISRLNSPNCPVRMLERYLACSGISPDSNEYIFRSLFSARTRRAGYVLRRENKPISYGLAREIILKAFQSIGLSKKHFGTHSLRKGGATAANLGKISDRLILKHGRWVSEKSKNIYISENLQERLSVSRNLGL